MVLLGLLALVAAEVAAFVGVAEQIGLFDALGLAVVVSLCGPWLVRRAGWGALREARRGFADGPAGADTAVLDGVLLLTAGLLICVPGFVTDAAGLLLLAPPVRAMARRRLRRMAAGSLLLRVAGPRTGAAREGRRPGRRRQGPVVDAASHAAPDEPDRHDPHDTHDPHDRRGGRRDRPDDRTQPHLETGDG